MNVCQKGAANSDILFSFVSESGTKKKKNPLPYFCCCTLGARNQIKGLDLTANEKEAGERKMEVEGSNNDTERLQGEAAGNTDKWLQVKSLYITFR